MQGAGVSLLYAAAKVTVGGLRPFPPNRIAGLNQANRIALCSKPDFVMMVVVGQRPAVIHIYQPTFATLRLRFKGGWVGKDRRPRVWRSGKEFHQMGGC